MEVGAYEAKTHLPKLLERVRRGERITITKRGKPVAELRAVETLSIDTVDQMFADMDALRGRLKKTNGRAADLRHAEHRY